MAIHDIKVGIYEKEYAIPRITFVTLDSNILIIKMYGKNGEVINLTNSTVRINYEDETGNKYYQDQNSGCIIKDAEKGSIEVTINNGIFNDSKEIKAEVVIRTGQDRITTNEFSFDSRFPIDLDSNVVPPQEIELWTVTLEKVKKQLDTSMADISVEVNDNANRISDISYKSADGSINDITLSKKGFTLDDGRYVEFKAKHTNTGHVTLNVNSSGAKSLKNADATELGIGDIKANSYYRAIYNGSFFLLASKGGIEVNDTKEGSFKIDAGETITKGDLIELINGKIIKVRSVKPSVSTKTVLNDDGPYDISVTRLTDEKALVCYKDHNQDDYDTVCILNINKTTVSAGPETVLNYNSDRMYHTLVTRLTDEKVLVCYTDVNNDDYSTACVLNIKGTTITAGPETDLNGNSPYDISLTRLTDEKALICYTDVKYRGTACILNIDGTTITAGPEMVFNSNRTYYISAIRLTDEKALVCYIDVNGDDCSTACVLKINGTTIKSGIETIINSDSLCDISLIRLTDEKALICYTDTKYNNHGVACILNIDDTTITVCRETIFNNDSLYDISLTRLTDEKALVCYQVMNRNKYGTACVLNIEGTTITADQEKVFNSNNTYDISVTRLTDEKALVCYIDVNRHNNKCIACVLNITKDPNGIALQNGTENQTIKVIHW
ncbi:hypothetical protein SH1V18_14850 [Vallitalea longa]|uniref:BppU N-terminal domain-containing protein n=1 Tax=Vallitalea longa TaxID=2936439 RepID=A0A9W5Y8A9_9FIRM|nr:BppU family phage baseplate upper protein [Vallitalea longa]GKX29005.1 hypothetical protein SH1V18_14850 [Vallitalea longa]